jgi:BTB/POZ domain/Ankyrin repeat
MRCKHFKAVQMDLWDVAEAGDTFTVGRWMDGVINPTLGQDSARTGRSRAAVAPGKWGRTPLHLAAMCGHAEVTQLLCRALNHAAPLVPVEQLQMAGNVARERGGAGLVDSNPAENQLPRGRRNDGEGSASSLGLKRVRALDVADDDGWTPLHWACRCAHIGVVRVLLGLPLEPPRSQRGDLPAAERGGGDGGDGGDGEAKTSLRPPSSESIERKAPRYPPLVCSRVAEDHRRRRAAVLVPRGLRTLGWLVDEVIEEESEVIQAILGGKAERPDYDEVDVLLPARAPHLLQLVGDAEFADAFFVLDDASRIPAHKAIVCQHDYFRALFVGPLASGESSDRRIGELSKETFLHMLRFMYAGIAPYGANDGRYDVGDPNEPNTSTEAALDVVELLRASDRFLLPALKHLCERLLCQEFVWRHRGMVGVFLTVALEFKCARLAAHCCRVVRRKRSALGMVLRSMPSECQDFIRRFVDSRALSPTRSPALSPARSPSPPRQQNQLTGGGSDSE